LTEHLLDHLEHHNLINDRQYGFRKSRSTGDFLAYVTNLWSSTLDKAGESVVVALDISKAFDRVWHSSLLNKLQGLGVVDTLVKWIASFLEARSIAVRLDGTTSERHILQAGVPQGSVLAPVLFLVFINDLLSIANSDLHCYADDSTLHRSFVPSARASSARVTELRQSTATSLSSDLSNIIDWGNANLVKFNSSKTQAVIVSRKKDSGDFPDFLMDDSVVNVEHSFTVLGVNITDSLKWCSHVKSIARAASRRLGILFRAKRLFSASQRFVLYKAQVRPLLEYCSHIWSGVGNVGLRLLDRVQSKAIRFIDSTDLTDNLHSLHHRRCVAALCLFYRYYFGKCSQELASAVPLPLVYNRVTRAEAECNPYRVRIPRCRTSAHSSSFFPRTAVVWNDLPMHCFPSCYNMQCFKTNVNKLRF